MPTMNIQISLKFHTVYAATKVLQNYLDLGLKEITINIIYNKTHSIGSGLGGMPYKASFHSSPGQLQMIGHHRHRHVCRYAMLFMQFVTIKHFRGRVRVEEIFAVRIREIFPQKTPEFGH